jgi:hypothetical protein
VTRKVEAFERFVNLHAIALGILQVLSLELADSIWQQFPRWFRTLPQHGYPTPASSTSHPTTSRRDDFSRKQASSAFAKIPRSLRLPFLNPIRQLN